MKPEEQITILLDKIKAEGHRITKVRQNLIELFSTHHRPLSVQDLISLLANLDIHVNKTTIYREISFLLLHKVIAELDLLEGKKRYEIYNENHRHHHLVCVQCKEIECVDTPGEFAGLEKWLKATRKFKVTSHLLEFFGLCRKCQ
jgi:Fe2+ or Zn2+ uptake regulation protein